MEEKIIMQRIEELKDSGAEEIKRMHNYIYYTLNSRKMRDTVFIFGENNYEILSVCFL